MTIRSFNYRFFKLFRAITIVLFFAVVSIILPLAQVHAAFAPPEIIGYQGRLTDSGGNLLGGTGTTYYFKFSIWNSPTVGSGSQLWPNTAHAVSATVKQGVFTVNIGDTANGYPDTLNLNFSKYNNLYLQVQVSSTNTTFETLSPRQRLTSALFAQVSGAVVGTTTASMFGTTTPVSNSFVTIAATSSNSIPLSISGTPNQTANLFQVLNNAKINLFSIGGKGGVTMTNATSTNFFATTASSTNLSTSNLSIGSLSGFLKATAGSVTTALVNLASDVTGILPIGNGGTGTSTVPSYGQLLIGNASGAYDLVATSTLGISGVTSVNISGGTTGLTTSGGPITSVGAITLSGVLTIAHGGTGVTSYTGNQILYSNTAGTALLTTGTSTLNIGGNAGTATKLATARTIAGVAFNGSANIFLNNNAIANGSGYTTNTGTVTSVSLSVPTGTGLTVSNSLITTSGTIALALTSGYTIPLTASTTNWNSAYNTVTTNSTNWNTAYTNRITSASLPLTITNNALSLTQANSTTNGYLSSTAYNTFNNKVSSTSLSAVTPLAYNSSTGAFTLGTVPVTKGGTGSTTLTGLLKGNGTGALQSATPGTDYLAGSAIGAGTQGQLPFYNASGNNLTPTSDILIAQNGDININTNTASPSYRLTVSGSTANDAISSDSGYNINPVLAPTTAQISLALVNAAGNVNAGLHYYRISYYTALGQTGTTNIHSITTDATHGQVTITLPTSPDPRVIGRKIYRSIVSSNASWKTYLIATIANNTATTYVDNIADASADTLKNGYFLDNSTTKFVTINGAPAMLIGNGNEPNTVFGRNAGLNLYSGNAYAGSNNFFGASSGQKIITGVKNDGFGLGTLHSLTSGASNESIGWESLGHVTTGSYNVGIGNGALYNVVNGSNNIAIGGSAGNGVFGVSNGIVNNTFVGRSSAYKVTTGSQNTIVGFYAGYNLAGGSYNSFFGKNTGYNTTGSNNILIGAYVDAPVVTNSKQLNIGNVLYGTGVYAGYSASGIPVAGGKIGIGTSAPQGVFQVQLPAWTNHDTNSQQVIFSNSTNNSAGLRFGFNQSSMTGVIDVLSPGVAWGNLVLQDGGGNVGIGTTTPKSTLTVKGSGCFSVGAGATLTCGTTAGNIYYTTANTGNYDVAEKYRTYNMSLSAGDVITLDVKHALSVTAATSSNTTFIGVISTAPGVLLGGASATGKNEKYVPVALSGRVPVKVSLADGAIAIGDKLTVSSTTPGVAVKMTGYGAYFGQALQAYSGATTTASSTIIAFINPGIVSMISLTGVLSASSTPASQSFTSSFFHSILLHITVWFSDSKNGITDFFANRVHTKELCLTNSAGETCITRAKLNALLTGASSINTNTSVSTITATSSLTNTTTGSSTPVTNLASTTNATATAATSTTDTILQIATSSPIIVTATTTDATTTNVSVADASQLATTTATTEATTTTITTKPTPVTVPIIATTTATTTTP